MNESTLYFKLCDHQSGFDKHLRNKVLDYVHDHTLQDQLNVLLEFVVDDRIQQNYPKFNFIYYPDDQLGHYRELEGFTIHPELPKDKFLCSFNGSHHVNRRLLVSHLAKRNWFDADTCSKILTYDNERIDGDIQDYTQDDERVFQKFFLSTGTFCNEVYKINLDAPADSNHTTHDHASNIEQLSNVISRCFVHLVSESIGNTYYPSVTEKTVYSIVNRGLWLAYAPPGYHDYYEKVYGYKKYNKIFDYSFDRIQDPVRRLVAMTDMLSKYSDLSTEEWHDLYQVESETIEYNYENYFSGRWYETMLPYINKEKVWIY